MHGLKKFTKMVWFQEILKQAVVHNFVKRKLQDKDQNTQYKEAC